jgi:hypothetical protein
MAGVLYAGILCAIFSGLPNSMQASFENLNEYLLWMFSLVALHLKEIFSTKKQSSNSKSQAWILRSFDGT